MAQTVVYHVYNNLYINLTNKCPCACTFCIRQLKDSMDDSGALWLEHEPEAEEVIEALQKEDLSKYNEIVFCGFGEPTERLEVLLKVAEYIKKNHKNSVRINTNGLGNLIHGRSIEKEFKDSSM